MSHLGCRITPMTRAGLLNPKQEEILFGLLDQGPEKSDRPDHRPELAEDLHRHIEDGLRPYRPEPPDDPYLAIRKNDISTVLDCEARWQATRIWDGWSVEKLVGALVHRAIDLHRNVD